jgi:hypothetical protein
MDNHFITYMVTKYVKENKIKVSNIIDPILLNQILLDVKKKFRYL